MESFSLTQLNYKDLRNGKYKGLIPEIYRLRNTVEVNSWHDNQNVFEHTVLVLRHLEDLLLNSGSDINKQMDFKLRKYRKRDLLKLAALYHDIGKPATIVTDKDGTTSCPGHEARGAEIALDYFGKYTLSEEELAYLKITITFHTHIIDFLKNEDGRSDEIKDLSNYKQLVGDLFLDLLLLFRSDLLGSDLEKTSPEEYENFKNKVELLIKEA